jgi:hypothetical protein
MRCLVQSNNTPQNRALIFSLAQKPEAPLCALKWPKPGSALKATLRVDDA